METEITDLLDLKNQTIYNVYDNEFGVGKQNVKNLYQENKEIYEKLIQSKDEQIDLLKQMLEQKNK